MSIPKEPRQLMINLMYLVLTAMLALNVSAEIINAFFALNKGIQTSNAIVGFSNKAIQSSINQQVDAYNTPENIEYKAVSEKATAIVKDFEKYISDITATLVERAGGVNPAYNDGRPVRYKDKDVSTFLFLTEGKGAELEKKVKEVRLALLSLFKDPKEKAEMEASIALAIDAIPSDSKAKSWSELKFKQMPVAACMPILTKLVADAKVSETSILNKMMEKTGATILKTDGFDVAIAPKTGYVIRGEEFSADVYLAAYSTSVESAISINVNGSPLPVKNGVAKYSTKAANLGKQTLKATATIKNPLNGEVRSYESTFDYEVGERSAALSADKMNVFYMGVDNPISVAVAGASSNDIRVSGAGVTVTGSGTKYIVTANAPGEATITVSATGITQKFPFRVKRIPNPVAMLGNGPNAKGGQMGSGEIKAQLGLAAVLENFDFDARCSIQSYEFTRIRKNEDAVTTSNNGARFESRASTLLTSARPGDSFLIDDIKARCPGDVASRNLGSISFRIR